MRSATLLSPLFRWLILALGFILPLRAELPPEMTNTARGKIVFEGWIRSQTGGTDRFVRIYLPPSYDSNPKARFPVLYIHDGQNAFTTAGTNAAFGWGSWELDRTVDHLIAEHKMQEVILVAVDCTAERYQDYRGPSANYSEAELKAMKRPPAMAGNDSRYTAYRDFLITELKPKMDREFRTLPGPAHTGLLGSSMGGIASLALAWDRPDVFGLAASLSGAFQVEKKQFLSKVLGTYKGLKKPVKVYLDSGNVDYTGGDDGRKQTEAVAAQLKRIGWREGSGGNLLHFVDETPMNEAQMSAAGLRKDKWAEAARSMHNEFYWRQRAWRALTFLFPPAN